MGSASELDYFALLSKDLGYLDASVHAEIAGHIDELKRMLGGLIGRVKPRLTSDN